MADRSHYERNLPHRLPPAATLFITYRLAGTLPREVVERKAAEAALVSTMPSRKPTFGDYDRWLDQDRTGPQWLAQPAVAAVIKESLHFYEPVDYILHAYCVMSNHVHLIVRLPPVLQKPFLEVLQAQKRYSAVHANRLLGRSGQFWARESYDHMVRSGPEYDRIVAYVVNNPVKAGLVADWRDWPHTYWAP